MATPPPAPVSTERFRLTSFDGLCIACARWGGRGPARAVVQIAHGMGEHIGRYADTVDALAAAGLAVYANDHRGHELSVHSQLGELGRGGFEHLRGLHALIGRCPDAGLRDIIFDSYPGGRHEMPNDDDRRVSIAPELQH
jgi:hypothetical protein